MNFTAKEISTIIRSCRDSGVKNLKIGDLDLSFHDTASVLPLEKESINAGLPKEVQDQIDDDISNDSDIYDLELQTLMIEDPVAYERFMRNQDAEEPSESKQHISRGRHST